jgi:capsid protein
LIEAALAADRIVCSFDAPARECFRRLAGLVGWVGDIAWIDPERDAEELLVWLRSRRGWRCRLRDQA